MPEDIKVLRFVCSRICSAVTRATSRFETARKYGTPLVREGRTRKKILSCIYEISVCQPWHCHVVLLALEPRYQIRTRPSSFESRRESFIWRNGCVGDSEDFGYPRKAQQFPRGLTCGRILEPRDSAPPVPQLPIPHRNS